MNIYKAFSAVVLIRGITAGSSTAATLVTTITSDYSFYCPEPTTFHHKNLTYTATEPTYLTITNCPCTVTYTQNTKSPEAVVYPTAPPGQPMSPTPPVMSSSAPAPPLPPSKLAPPPTKATVPYSEPYLPSANPKSTVPIPEAPPPPPPPPAATSEPSPPKATVPAAITLPPPPPPEVSVPAPGSPPPSSIPGQPAVPPSRAAPPSVNPTGTIEASVPSAAANKVSGSFGAFVLAGVAALAM
ncbi:cell wall SED1 [Fusarium phyllophilum]|uniref:Cell wall SED1 n=1 Tax=Fusarium phyllophilum TaxID=47803 RepID=A0A8H5IXX6_9HYPO|nr:cell wall SED1 [Fusarium phyllophilum]